MSDWRCSADKHCTEDGSSDPPETYGLPSAMAGRFYGDVGMPPGRRVRSLLDHGPRCVDDGAGDLGRLGNCDLGSEALNAEFRLQTLHPAISRKRLPVRVMRLISPRSGR